MARTQEQRRDETRRRLLAAAAEVVAEHGVDAASVDAIADAAGRTSGSVYAHFGSKDGLVTALLDSWKNDVAAAVAAEFVTARSLDQRLRALWRNVSDPPTDEERRWVRLEHELWLYAARHPEVRQRLARRYHEAWGAIAAVVERWGADGEVVPPRSAQAAGPLLVGLLLGLEMQHRLDPAAVTDDVAVAGLRAVLGAPPEPAPGPRRRRRTP